MDLLGGATMQAIETDQQLCAAITRRSLVMFEYGDLIRVVEPHRLGVNGAGQVTLSGWLRAGYSRTDPAGGWRTYLTSQIRALQLLDAPFAGSRPGYAAHDARMREVLCELTPSAVDTPADGVYILRDPALRDEPLPERTQEPSPRESPKTRTHGESDPPQAMV